MKRPTVTDAADKKYNTASTFVDVGSVPEYSCTFPFRVPEGTKLKALQIEDVVARSVRARQVTLRSPRATLADTPSYAMRYTAGCRCRATRLRTD